MTKHICIYSPDRIRNCSQLSTHVLCYW